MRIQSADSLNSDWLDRSKFECNIINYYYKFECNFIESLILSYQIRNFIIVCFFSMVWNLSANKKEMDIAGHAGDIVSISMAPDMKTYITGSVDRTCKLWEVNSENAKQTFFGHQADVNSVCVSGQT